MIARGNICAIFQPAEMRKQLRVRRLNRQEKKERKTRNRYCSQHVSLARLGPVVQCLLLLLLLRMAGLCRYIRLHTHRLIIKVVKERWGALASGILNEASDKSVRRSKQRPSQLGWRGGDLYANASYWRITQGRRFYPFSRAHTRIETCFQLVICPVRELHIHPSNISNSMR